MCLRNHFRNSLFSHTHTQLQSVYFVNGPDLILASPRVLRNFCRRASHGALLELPFSIQAFVLLLLYICPLSCNFSLAGVYFKNMIVTRFICHGLTRWAVYHHTNGTTPNGAWLHRPVKWCTWFNHFKLDSRAIRDPVAYLDVFRLNLHV